MLSRLIVSTDDPKQAHRIRRMLMAAAASSMVVAILFVSHLPDVLSLRGADVLGRYGGEEFMAVLDQTSIQGSGIVAGGLCALARTLIFDDLVEGMRISVSIGGAQYRKAEHWQATIDRADRALYRAKQAGRDRFELENAYDEEAVQTRA